MLGNLMAGNLKLMILKKDLLFQASTCKFHAKIQKCKMLIWLWWIDDSLAKLIDNVI